MSTYAYGSRLDDDSFAITYIDEETREATTRGAINGVEFESGGGESSDFSTAKITINYTGEYCMINAPFATNNGTITYTEAQSGSASDIVLYKGRAMIFSNGGIISNPSGAIEYDSASDMYIVTGDCSLTEIF